MADGVGNNADGVAYRWRYSQARVVMRGDRGANENNPRGALCGCRLLLIAWFTCVARG